MPSSTTSLTKHHPSCSVTVLEVMVQLLKERNEELERLAEENQRLTKEIEAYAVVLQGCMEAQELWNQKVRVTLLVRVGVILLCLTSYTTLVM